MKPWPHKFIRQPLREFWRRYVTLQGYKDGWLGLKLAVLLGFYYGFMPHWYLLEKRDCVRRENVRRETWACWTLRSRSTCHVVTFHAARTPNRRKIIGIPASISLSSSSAVRAYPSAGPP